MVKSISITDGCPTYIPALSFVIFVSMIKDFVEELSRWREDSKENLTQITKLMNGIKTKVNQETLLLGDVIEVQNDQFIPADILVFETNGL